MTRRQAKRRGVTDKPESPIFIRQPYESERENGFYGAFLHVSRLNPGIVHVVLFVAYLFMSFLP